MKKEEKGHKQLIKNYKYVLDFMAKNGVTNLNEIDKYLLRIEEIEKKLKNS